MRNAGATYDIEGECCVYVYQNRINRVIERLYGAKALHLFYAHTLSGYMRRRFRFSFWKGGVSYSTYLHVRGVYLPKGDAIGRPPTNTQYSITHKKWYIINILHT